MSGTDFPPFVFYCEPKLAMYNRISVSSARTSYVLTLGTILHSIDYTQQYF
jgi:hypothetical protein